MAIAPVSQGGETHSAGTSATQAFDCGSGATKLWLAVEVQGGGDVMTGATYNGDALTLAVKRIAYFGAGFYEYLWYIDTPDAGSNNIVASFSASTASAFAYASYSGTTTGTDSVVDSDGPDLTTFAQAFTTVANNCWTINFLRTGDGGSNPTAGTGDVERTTVTGDAGLGLFDSNTAITPAGSYTMNYTTPVASQFTSIGASFAPSGGAVVYSQNNLTLLGVS